MHTLIKEIITASINAPSGDNSQPWRFLIRHNVLSIFNLPERDLTLYNHAQYGSFLAHGALVENILINASCHSLTATVEVFPEPHNDIFVSRLTFTPAAIQADSLQPSISQRSTNRKMYAKTPLAPAELDAFKQSVAEAHSSAKLHIIEDPRVRSKLADALSANERILLENKTLHDVFFSHVRWSHEEEQKYRTGLYAKTLELAPPQLAVFKLCRRWGFLSLANRLGLSKFIAKENAKTYGSGALFGIVTIANEDKKNYFDAGRVIERIWLKATKFGLGFQPVTAIPYLALKVAAEPEVFSEAQAALITASEKTVRSLFHINQEPIAMIFRIGHASSPSATSSRLQPEIIIE